MVVIVFVVSSTALLEVIELRFGNWVCCSYLGEKRKENSQDVNWRLHVVDDERKNLKGRIEILQYTKTVV